MKDDRSIISLPIFSAKGKPRAADAKNAALFPMRLWRDEAERQGRFGEGVHDEFAPGASEWPEDLSRRNFLKVAGASLAVGALAGAAGTGCDYVPETKIVPYVNPPAAVVPGQPTFYATAMPISGFGLGELVESHEGRPTKIEGNPDHPGSLGRSNVYMQASVLQLYDPQRAREVRFAGESSTWDLFLASLQDRLDARQNTGGKGIALLIGRTTSPTLLALLAEFQHRYPAARIHLHEPIGRDVSGPWPMYQFENAKVVLSLDSDFLFEEPGSIHYAMKFADSRRVRQDRTEISRLYVAEGQYSMTGSMADHRLPIKPSEVASIAAAVAREIGVADGGGHLPPPPDRAKAWIAAVAADLKRAGKGGLVVPGMFQSAAVHALAAAMNRALGSVGNCVAYYHPQTEPAGVHSRSQLLADMQSGATDTLLILGINPAYDAPADLHFADALEHFSRTKSPGGNGYRNFSAHLGLYYDETSFRCQWHVPESHYLESWGDLRAYDGSASIVQPLILPMYPSKSAIELFDRMHGRMRGGYEIVRGYWLANHTTEPFDPWWQETLRKGVISNSAHAPAAAAPPAYTASMAAPAPSTRPADENAVEIIFRPDPTVYDGSFASLGWLQECPKPFTKLTWDNAALIGAAMARKHGLIDGDMVRLTLRGESLDCGVLVLPGQADGTLTLHLGYGRTHAGEVGNGRGFDANRLRFSDSPWFAAGATMTKLEGRHYEFAVTRSHHGMDAVGQTYAKNAGIGPLRPEDVETPDTPDYDVEIHNRKLVRVMDISQYTQGNPKAIIRRLGGASAEPPLLSLYPGWDYSKGMQWGMSIDLNSCIGCNACVVACVAENNIATVGKDQVIRQREMHWIRIDDYFAGDEDAPKVFHEPVPCQQCENAPCELVCPVGATTHSEDGLNEMTYNRCVGTRYCSNNCPYKVRRFNFLLFSDELTVSIRGQRNPEVTVRSRGVMEKCTYCVQRIRRTKVEIEKMQVELESQARAATTDAERQALLARVHPTEQEMLASLQSACQQACPTNAIVFGNKNDPESPVAKLKREPLDYTLLTELTTVPRTSYLARVTNRNPVLHEGPA